MIVNAVAIVAESFYDEQNNTHKDNFHLWTWVGCCFKGDETFEIVCEKLKQKFNRVGDYLS